MYDPDRYESFKSTSAIDAEEFVPQLISGMTWKSNEKILDYGCGAGSTCFKHFIPMAQLNNSTIDAVDISEDMLNYAKSKYSHPLVTYYQGNIVGADFPLKETKFDRIFLIYVLPFIKNYKNALSEFYNILKPGGELGFTSATTGVFQTMLETFGESTKWGPYMKGYEMLLPVWHETGSDAAEYYQKALLEIGFTIIEIRTEERKNMVETDTFVQFLMSVNPYLKQIPKHLHTELEADFRRELTSYLKVSIDDKNIYPDYDVVFCIAKKANNATTNTD